MTRLLCAAVLMVGLGVPALGLGLGGTLGAGPVDMAFLNSQLEFAADRQGTTFSPIRFAWEAGADVWVWPFAGVGLTWIHGAGTTHGREPQEQGVTAWVISGVGRLDVPLFGWPLGIEGGLSTCWGRASGVVTGAGLGWGGHVSLSWRFLSLGPLRLGTTLTWRYLVVPALYDVRGGRIESRDWPGADFSGFYFGFTVEWR